jgi:hypothetical protein
MSQTIATYRDLLAKLPAVGRPLVSLYLGCLYSAFAVCRKRKATVQISLVDMSLVRTSLCDCVFLRLLSCTCVGVYCVWVWVWVWVCVCMLV